MSRGFHVKPTAVDRVAAYFSIDLSDGQRELLALFESWLADEAATAGAIGPGEVTKLRRRHIADSLLYAGFVSRPHEAWDLGSGAGLPGIPLAIALPETSWKLVDRSGKRADLMRRASRVLKLENVEVVESDILSMSGTVEAMVARASLPPDRLRTVALKHLASGGIAVTGGSWRSRPRAEGWQTLEIPREVLDRPVWLLMMRSQ